MKIGISASAVLSRTERLDELFLHDVDHIEIGLIENRAVADRFVRRARQRGKSVGIHSPLVRSGSKYDLLEAIDRPTDDAWKQVEEELDWCRRSRVEYLLVHFPYASKSGILNLPLVVEGVQRLQILQLHIGVKIVCEPNLGDDLDPAGICWLKTAPRRIFTDTGLSLCWDVGDHLLGSRSEKDYYVPFDRWRSLISVIHLHNVRMEGWKYRWTPPHPTRSAVDSDYDLRRIVKQFPSDATVVSEYTPQKAATSGNIETSFQF